MQVNHQKNVGAVLYRSGCQSRYDRVSTDHTTWRCPDVEHFSGTKEQEILAWALKSAVSDLGAEIADTENMEFRQDLKERKAVLRSILQRLER